MVLVWIGIIGIIAIIIFVWLMLRRKGRVNSTSGTFDDAIIEYEAKQEIKRYLSEEKAKDERYLKELEKGEHDKYGKKWVAREKKKAKKSLDDLKKLGY